MDIEKIILRLIRFLPNDYKNNFLLRFLKAMEKEDYDYRVNILFKELVNELDTNLRYCDLFKEEEYFYKTNKEQDNDNK